MTYRDVSLNSESKITEDDEKLRKIKYESNQQLNSLESKLQRKEIEFQILIGEKDHEIENLSREVEKLKTFGKGTAMKEDEYRNQIKNLEQKNLRQTQKLSDLENRLGTLSKTEPQEAEKMNKIKSESDHKLKSLESKLQTKETEYTSMVEGKNIEIETLREEIEKLKKLVNNVPPLAPVTGTPLPPVCAPPPPCPVAPPPPPPPPVSSAGSNLAADLKKKKLRNAENNSLKNTRKTEKSQGSVPEISQHDIKGRLSGLRKTGNKRASMKRSTEK